MKRVSQWLPPSLFACTVLSICCFPPSVFAQVSFYQTPFNSAAAQVVFESDLTGNGKLDLVGLNGTVLLGKGDGTFSTGTPISLPSGTSNLAIADFNNDGKPDVVAVNGFQLSVFLGNGDGTFQPPINSYVGVTFYYFAVGDFNNDGNLDIVGESGPNLMVLLGNGKGGFTLSPTQYPAEFGGNIAVGDFNGDGNLDLALAGFVVSGATDVSMVAVLLGNGKGGFAAPITTSLPSLQQVSILSQGDNFGDGVADFNGDGKLDLVVGNTIFQGRFNGADSYTYQTFTLLGKGDGTFQPPADAVSVSNLAIAFGDINGDSKIDMVVDDAQFSQIFLGNGDGSFTSGQICYDGFNAAGNVVLGDFNGDGKPDAEIAGAMLLGNGNGTFQAAPAVLPGGNQVVTADFNHDGKQDIAEVTPVYPNPQELLVLLGEGNGQFSLANSYVAPGTLQAVADINGDGNPDLVFATVSNNVLELAIMLGDGKGGFGTPIVTSGGSDQAPGAPMIAIGDFNHDGKPDVAAIPAFSEGTSVLVFLGNGDGTFASPVSYFAGSGPSNVVVADVNDDGKLDLIVSSVAGLAILLGNGDGTFQSANFITTTQSYVFAAADLTGNGSTDLLTDGAVLLNNGNDTFQTLSEPSVQSGLLADFNGDGKLDLAVNYNFVSYVILGNGDGTFGNPINIATSQKYGLGFSFAAAADFNGDGKPDLAAEIGPVGVGNGIAILLNTTSPPTPGFQLSASAPSPATITAGASATSTVTIAPSNGFTGTVDLTCSVTPAVTPAPSCTVTPQSMKVSGSPATAKVTIASTESASAATISYASFPPSTALVAGFSMVLCFGSLLLVRRQRIANLAPIVLAMGLWAACGSGGDSSTTTPNSTATPAGTYKATITATSGAVSSTTQIVVVIQ